MNLTVAKNLYYTQEISTEIPILSEGSGQKWAYNFLCKKLGSKVLPRTILNITGSVHAQLDLGYNFKLQLVVHITQLYFIVLM